MDFSHIFFNVRAKVRISENNAKGKLAFLFIVERKYLCAKLKMRECGGVISCS